MNPETIDKASHYRSFYNVAKKLKDPAARLAFYDALDAFRFDGVLPENLPLEADIAFTAIEPFLQADVKRKTDRANAGNNDGRLAIDVTAEELREAYKDVGNWRAVAALFGISRQTAYKIIKNDVNTDVNRVNENVNVKKHNDNVNVNVNVNDNDTEAAKPPCPQKPPVKRFQKPTVEEVRAYCQSRRNNIDAEAFIAFYDSKGWVVGNSPMKDWKAAVITWEKRPERAHPSLFQQRASPIRQVDAVISDALLAKL